MDAESQTQETSEARPGTVMIANTMLARRAYRKYHGQYHPSYASQSHKLFGLIVLLWGIYTIHFGSVQDALCQSDPAKEGLTIAFLWAYKDNGVRWLSAVIFIVDLLVIFLLIKLQAELGLQASFWVTLLTCLVLFSLAVADAASDGDRLPVRSALMVIWLVTQLICLAVGFFRKKALPWIHMSGKAQFMSWDSKAITPGVSDELREQLNNKLSAETVDDIMLEANSAPIFTFEGVYYQGFRYFLHLLGGKMGARRIHYVGQIDDEGLPHGVGFFEETTRHGERWNEEASHGERLFGRWVHGKPVAPFRAREYSGTGFSSYRVAVLMARDDGVASQGAFTPAYSAATPLRQAVASVECCTSGKFFRGFPSVVWIKRPTRVPDRLAGTSSLPRIVDSATERDISDMARPTAVAEGLQAESSRALEGGDGKPELEGDSASDAALGKSGISNIPHKIGELKAAGSRVHMQHVKHVWDVPIGDELASSDSITDFMFVQSESGMLQRLGGLSPDANGNFEVLFFIHGFNSSIEDACKLLGQLLALGSFPSHVMPVVFGWPCTAGAFYLNSSKTCRDSILSDRIEEALRLLATQGCRSVHLFGHSMGARVLANAAPRVAAIFGEQGVLHRDMRVETITFLSPDIDLGDFIGRVEPALRSVCSFMTVYGDSRDEALGWAEVGNGLLYRWDKNAAPPHMLETCRKLGIKPGASLGKHCQRLRNEAKQDLDVDIIVTNQLDSNIHGLRHNYFHINREMVEDIREVVVERKRASERFHRLERSDKSVFGFLVAPSYVTAA